MGCLFMIGLTLDKTVNGVKCVFHILTHAVSMHLFEAICIATRVSKSESFGKNVIFIHFTGWYTFKLLDSFSNGGFANDVPY